MNNTETDPTLDRSGGCRISEACYLIPLTADQRRSLLSFLRRSQLSGAEAPAFLQITTLISNSNPAPKPTPTSSLPPS